MGKTAHIIVGLGYGDEGKGLVTDYYCKKSSKAIVVRFNGGQQAGHTVHFKDGRKHTFSNFGVGSYLGIPTYWSSYCSFSPGFFLEELNELRQAVAFYLDRASPVTTHYDILFNRMLQRSGGRKRHSSCGLGVGPTFLRHKELEIKLTADDLMDPEKSTLKLKRIKAYYKQKIQKETNFLFYAFDHDLEDQNFETLLSEFRQLVTSGVIHLVHEPDILSNNAPWQDYIFEGAQGILLDQTLGQQPFVTKSNTTSRNAIELINRNFKKNEVNVTISYVTRAYMTRHGDGPFKIGKPQLQLRNTAHESNRYNECQGAFKIGYLDLDLLNYALECDANFSNNYRKELFVTCLDQIDSAKIPVFLNGVKTIIGFEMIQALAKQRFARVRHSFSRFSEDLADANE